MLEVLLSDRPLRAAMFDYSVNIIWLAALISIITAGLLYLTINRLLVRPMRRLTENMVGFSEAPEDTARIIQPSGRADEIGVAEEHLAAMERDLQGTLREQRHLADLGLAVSKINHDLRNMLASAQLFSDRLGSLPDPNVQRFAPKLIGALDRAIAYCQSTLAYGRAREAAPSRRLVALDRLVDDVADVLGLVGHAMITWENRVPPGLEVDADPEQLFRVLVNLCRNAMQALESSSGPAVVRRLTVSAAREGASVSIKVRRHRPRRSGAGTGASLPRLPGHRATGRHRPWPGDRRRACARPWRLDHARRYGQPGRDLRDCHSRPAAHERTQRVGLRLVRPTPEARPAPGLISTRRPTGKACNPAVHSVASGRRPPLLSRGPDRPGARSSAG